MNDEFLLWSGVLLSSLVSHCQLSFSVLYFPFPVFLSFLSLSLSLSLSLPPFPSQPYGVFLAFQHWSHGWVRQGGITNFSQPVSSTTLIENKKLYFQAMKILFIHSL